MMRQRQFKKQRAFRQSGAARDFEGVWQGGKCASLECVHTNHCYLHVGSAWLIVVFSLTVHTCTNSVKSDDTNGSQHGMLRESSRLRARFGEKNRARRRAARRRVAGRVRRRVAARAGRDATRACARNKVWSCPIRCVFSFGHSHGAGHRSRSRGSSWRRSRSTPTSRANSTTKVAIRRLLLRA